MFEVRPKKLILMRGMRKHNLLFIFGRNKSKMRKTCNLKSNSENYNCITSKIRGWDIFRRNFLKRIS